MAFQLGTVSHGTLKTDDLLNSFSDELETRAKALGRLDVKWEQLISDARVYAKVAEEGHLNADGEQYASAISDELGEALNELCPDYVRFGAHEGDGSDFGFWPDIQRLEEDAREGDVLKVDDTGAVPAGHRGVVVYVSDHGNISVYINDDKGEMVELWSCV